MRLVDEVDWKIQQVRKCLSLMSDIKKLTPNEILSKLSDMFREIFNSEETSIFVGKTLSESYLVKTALYSIYSEQEQNAIQCDQESSRVIDTIEKVSSSIEKEEDERSNPRLQQSVTFPEIYIIEEKNRDRIVSILNMLCKEGIAKERFDKMKTEGFLSGIGLTGSIYKRETYCVRRNDIEENPVGLIPEYHRAHRAILPSKTLKHLMAAGIDSSRGIFFLIRMINKKWEGRNDNSSLDKNGYTAEDEALFVELVKLAYLIYDLCLKYDVHETLYELLESVALMHKSETIDEILDTMITRLALMIAPSIYGSIFEVNEKDKKFIVRASTNSSLVGREVPIRKGESLINKAFFQREMLFIFDVRQEPQYRSPYPGATMRSEIVVPIRDGEKITGIINLENEENFQVSADEELRKMLEIFAEHAGIAIKLRKEAKEREDFHVKAIRDAAKIQASEKMFGLLHEIVKDLNYLSVRAKVAQFSNDEEKNTYLQRMNACYVMADRGLKSARVYERKHGWFYINHLIQHILSEIYIVLADNEKPKLKVGRFLDQSLNLPNQANEAYATEIYDMPQSFRQSIMGNPCFGNKYQIEQIIRNLLENAIKASYETGTVEVHTVPYPHRLPNPKIKIMVKDYGQGISADQKSKIMEPFYTTSRESGGTGLGLWICNNILEEYASEIEFESQGIPGASTSFWFYLDYYPKKD